MLFQGSWWSCCHSLCAGGFVPFPHPHPPSGLHWAGEAGSFPDMPHCSLPSGVTPRASQGLEDTLGMSRKV